MADTLEMESIQRARQGDPKAIGDLYQAHHLSVFRYLYYRCGDQQVAEDLTSEVFIRMIRSLPGYEPQDVPFLAWLFRVAHNVSIDHYRKASSTTQLPLEETLNSGSDELIKTVDRRLNNQWLSQALEHLNDDQRDVIFLRFIAGMPIAEVAQTLSKSEDAIKGLQRRGLTALRQTLTEWEISYA